MADIPRKFKKLMVDQKTFNFREACSVHEVTTPQLEENEVLVKNYYVGINASDKNVCAGRYDSSLEPPFPCGFEGLGEVVQKGSKVGLSLKQPVAYMSHGAFGQYHVMKEDGLIPLPELKKEYLSLVVSGLTAGVALEKTAEMKGGETVVVTAAAGGTGQFAVQLAKLAGCHVIGTCSTESKAQMLKELGCDRVVNYKVENLNEVLSKEYPKGIDIAYESVGEDMFDACVDNLAIHGKVIIIGFITGYENMEAKSKTLSSLPLKLLGKNGSVRGFFLPANAELIQPTAKKLFELYMSKKLKCLIDDGSSTEKGPFIGLESIADAVDYLYSKKSTGKVVVQLAQPSGGH